MVFQERVMDYSVSTLRNDIVEYRRILRLTTVSGDKLFLAFPEVPPADWLQFVGGSVNVFLPATDFDATYRVLREESPVFVTALNLIGLRAFSLGSGDEAPGQGLTDPEELVHLMNQARITIGGGVGSGRRPGGGEPDEHPVAY
jgi:hypothetical protein